jgi:PAS domain S-box-containing protein
MLDATADPPSRSKALVAAGSKASRRLWRDRLHRGLLDEALPVSLFIHDHAGCFVEVNEHACGSVGYSRAELLAMNVVDLEQDYDLASVQAAWACVEEGANNHLYGHHRHRDSHVFPVQVRIGLMVIGRRRFYICVVRDMSRQQDAVETLPAKARARAAPPDSDSPVAALPDTAERQQKADFLLTCLSSLIGSAPRDSATELEWARSALARLELLEPGTSRARVRVLLDSLQRDFEAWLGPNAWAVSSADVVAARSELLDDLDEVGSQLQPRS